MRTQTLIMLILLFSQTFLFGKNSTQCFSLCTTCFGTQALVTFCNHNQTKSHMKVATWRLTQIQKGSPLWHQTPHPPPPESWQKPIHQTKNNQGTSCKYEKEFSGVISSWRPFERNPNTSDGRNKLRKKSKRIREEI